MLNEQLIDSKIKDAVEKISDAVLVAEFDSAAKTTEELVATLKVPASLPS